MQIEKILLPGIFKCRKMFDLTREILADRARWEKMHAASLEMGTLDASEKIYETVMSLCK